ncbi:MAG: S-adenosylmethionine:tRNA ribosyltransferase-isomerase [Ferruginibacter sp.]|nr:S-adenosylmethionine:tRNA ribosyltransferase-isomerase [Ferruginibacter sp.]
MKPQSISILDYNYDLPNEKIAMHPLSKRDASKLLIFKDEKIVESVFSEIATQIPEKSLLIFNNSKVINARIKFSKATGANIEIFCLEPHGNIDTYEQIMVSNKVVQWKCFVGGAAKWKDDILEKEIAINNTKIILFAKKIEKITESFVVEFSWNNTNYTFAQIIEASGSVPLPPYIKRITDNEDTSRYQTIFAKTNGSVAAPTAGLHFSENIFEKLIAKNIIKSFVTLHVGAGTFKPVKSATMEQHEMHAEYIDVDYCTIENLQKSIGKIVAVGTTSLRTIETLYWLGVKIFFNPSITALTLLQWDVYEEKFVSNNINANEALQTLLYWMKKNNKQSIFTKTQILIVPGYTFRIANMLVTNFHQPCSTLLLLVAAAVGNNWKKMYDYALKNEFRFLSYGDGNLIFIDN